MTKTGYRAMHKVLLLAVMLLALGAGAAKAAPVLTAAHAKDRIKAIEPESTDPIVRCMRLAPQRIACLVLAYQPVTKQVINAETGAVEGEETVRGVPIPIWADVEKGARIRWSFEVPPKRL